MTALAYRASLLWLLQVKKTYSNGTYRAGAMRQISLVGAVDEEVGDYFPEFLSMLEDSPFLKVSHEGNASVFMCSCEKKFVNSLDFCMICSF